MFNPFTRLSVILFCHLHPVVLSDGEVLDIKVMSY